MVDTLTQEQIAEFKNAFDLYDKDEDGFISIESVGIVMRALGINPTEIELQNIVNDQEDEGDKGADPIINFQQFLSLIYNKLKIIKIEEELIQACEPFDYEGKGLIFENDFRYAVGNLVCEIFNDEEVAEMLREFGSDDDEQIKYKELARMLSG